MSDNQDPASQYWHLDKRINLATLVPGLVLAASFIWWAALMDSRVTKNEQSIKTLTRAVERLSEDRARLVRIETIVERLDRTHERQDRKEGR